MGPVLYSDVDTEWMKPVSQVFDFSSQSVLHIPRDGENAKDGIDWQKDDMCTCFLYSPSTCKTIKLMERWAALKTGGSNDQITWKLAVQASCRDAKECGGETLAVSMFPKKAFPNGRDAERNRTATK